MGMLGDIRGIISAYNKTMELQQSEMLRKKIVTKPKKIAKPEVKILFADMAGVNTFESLIADYYERGFKLTGNISMHGSQLCATLIKE